MFIFEYFVKKYCENLIEINFVKTPSYSKIFGGDLDAKTILANISLYANLRIIPKKTLFFLDEIQACPKARTALKFLMEGGIVDVIASGSLLGVSYQEIPSYPTGYVDFLEMHPLSFKEFLWAAGMSEDVLGIIEKCFEETVAVNEAMNAKLLELFRQYIVVGGMPNVVNSFFSRSRFRECFETAKEHSCRL